MFWGRASESVSLISSPGDSGIGDLLSWTSHSSHAQTIPTVIQQISQPQLGFYPCLEAPYPQRGLSKEGLMGPQWSPDPSPIQLGSSPEHPSVPWQHHPQCGPRPRHNSPGWPDQSRGHRPHPSLSWKLAFHPLTSICPLCWEGQDTMNWDGKIERTLLARPLEVGGIQVVLPLFRLLFLLWWWQWW